MNPLKQFVFRHRFLWNLYEKLKSRNGGLKITNNGMVRIRKQIQGTGHELIVHENTVLTDVVIHMRGTNNKIVFGADCHVGPGCSFWTEGSNVTIVIGSHTTFTRNVQINAQEDNTRIEIGNDCMFSNQIIVRTSDSHPIYDASGKRINPAKSVKLGNHVWIAPNSKIMKGVAVGDGVIIGSDTMVTKDVPDNALVVGHPARVVKEGIRWTREDVIFHNSHE